MIYTDNNLIDIINNYKQELQIIFKYIKSKLLIHDFINKILTNNYFKNKVYNIFDNIFNELNFDDIIETNKFRSCEITYLYYNYCESIDTYDYNNVDDNKLKFIILLCHIYKKYIDKYEEDII